MRAELKQRVEAIRRQPQPDHRNAVRVARVAVDAEAHRTALPRQRQKIGDGARHVGFLEMLEERRAVVPRCARAALEHVVALQSR